MIESYRSPFSIFSFDLYDSVIPENVKQPNLIIKYKTNSQPYIILTPILYMNKFHVKFLQNVQNYATGWIDWSMALDTMGGPAYFKNYVDAPIIVNTSAGEFYKQPMYYALGHFSKFVKPGSFRIESQQNNHNLLVVAFIRPDNATVITILNM